MYASYPTGRTSRDACRESVERVCPASARNRNPKESPEFPSVSFCSSVGQCVVVNRSYAKGCGAMRVRVCAQKSRLLFSFPKTVLILGNLITLTARLSPLLHPSTGFIPGQDPSWTHSRSFVEYSGCPVSHKCSSYPLLGSYCPLSCDPSHTRLATRYAALLKVQKNVPNTQMNSWIADRLWGYIQWIL